MQNDQHFSVYGSGYEQARQQGWREFRNSLAWRPVVRMWGVSLIVFTLGAALTHVVIRAEAGAQLSQKIFSTK